MILLGTIKLLDNSKSLKSLFKNTFQSLVKYLKNWRVESTRVPTLTLEWYFQIEKSTENKEKLTKTAQKPAKFAEKSDRILIDSHYEMQKYRLISFGDDDVVDDVTGDVTTNARCD